uniref:Uncharacterized protein n=1 Tax=Erpetoichthys calabaricus TaxID=27687 RepID=A0A8C4S5A7_ERPCA
MSTLQTTELLIDPKDLQIRTVTVEKLLEPLITQVTTLINCPRNPSNKKKGCSKRARVLLRSVEDATLHLVEKGEKIAKDSNLLKNELMEAVDEVWKESKCNGLNLIRLLPLQFHLYSVLLSLNLFIFLFPYYSSHTN